MKTIKCNTGYLSYGDVNSLEKIILLRSIIGSMIIILLYLTYGIFTNDLKIYLPSGFAFLIYGACYKIITYTNGSTISKRIVVSIIALTLIPGFFAQGGLFGINALNMCGLIILISVAFSGRDRQIFISFYIAMLLFFVWVHLFHKNWIADYRENYPETFLVAEILVYIIYILYIGYLYKSEYEKNQQIVVETNRELEDANTEISAQNDHIMSNNDQLKALVEELQTEQNKVLEANRLLKKANSEIAKKNEYITTINTKLEAIVAERTNDIKELNKKIVHFAQYNAHRIRGPLARIIGLVQVMNFDFMSNETLDKEQSGFYIETLQENAHELDEMVRGVTALLSENDKFLKNNKTDKNNKNNHQ